MKNIINAIKNIEGVKTVEHVDGSDLCVVVFEWPVAHPVFFTEDGVKLYNYNDICWSVRLDDYRVEMETQIMNIINFEGFKYFSTETAARNFANAQKTLNGLQEKIAKEQSRTEKEQSPFFSDCVSTATLSFEHFGEILNPKPEDKIIELIDGEIYKRTRYSNVGFIFRYKKHNDSCKFYTAITVGFDEDDYIMNNGFIDQKFITHASVADKKKLILTEVSNGYFHGIS